LRIAGIGRADRLTAVRIPAVILAGGRNKPDMEAAAGTPLRALISVHGKPMLKHVAAALADAKTIDRVIVVGDVPDSADFHRIPDHGGFVENVYAGLNAAGESELALIVTSDIPFLSSAAVDDFVDRARGLDSDLVYPIVRVEQCYASFPG